MRDTTLCFLVESSEDKYSKVLLAMKKRGFGVNWYNGVGGKTNPGESIKEAAVRESFEEVAVRIDSADLKKVAVIKFEFSENPEWDQMMYVFMVEKWEGKPIESEEMKPEWFKVDEIPYNRMWPDDPIWLPYVLDGKKVNAYFEMDKDNNILAQEVTVVEDFN